MRNNFIELILKRENMSASEFATKIGVNAATVHRWINGHIKTIKVSTVIEIAKQFNININWILGKSDNYRIYNKKICDNTNFIKIPILGNITCTNDMTAIENIKDHKIVHSKNLHDGNLFYLYAKDDSMKPLINNGDLVLINEQPDAENDDIVAFLFSDSNKITFKRIKKKDNIIFLLSENSKYDPIIIDENSNAKIIGKAIEVTSKL